MKKVLFIGAHYDDIELWCLWTILKFKKMGYEIKIVVATHSWYIDTLTGHVRKKEEALNESKNIENYLGISFIRLNHETLSLSCSKLLVWELIDIINDFAPDMVFTHYNNDINTDHVAISQATFIAAKYVPTLLMYQVNNYTAPITHMLPNVFVNIDDFRSEKCSILNLYTSELKKISNWIKNIEVKSLYYWWMVGCKFAEWFFTTKFYLP